MADLKAKDLEERYDQLVQDIIEQLNRVLNDLKSVKENEKRARTELVRGTYYSNLRLIAGKKRKNKLYVGPKQREMVRAGKVKWKGSGGGPYYKYYFEKIRPLEEELMKLVEEKIEIDKKDYKTFEQDQQRLNDDIKKIETLLNYIKQNTKDKKARRALNTRDMYDAIKAVYRDGINSIREAEITKGHQELKRKIEQKADQILRELNDLIAAGPS